mgnify:CR=1 FL=1
MGLGKKNNPKVRRSLQEACTLVRNEAVKSIMSGGKTGITSTRYDPKRTHTASAEGEAPASDTGFLVSQITQEVSGDIGKVISSSPYSAALEFGTVNMGPRPFLRPALNKSKAAIRRIFVKRGLA